MTTTTRPFARAAALVGIAAAASALAGCGDGRGRAALETTAKALTSDEIGRVVSFENPTSDWSVVWSGAGTISSSNVASAGLQSLGLQGHDYVALQSIAVSSLGAARVDNVFKYDLRLPTAQPNPSWFGGTEAFVSIPSLGVNNAPIGQAELTGRPLNEWFTISFSLPSSLRTKLVGNYNDLRFTIALNLPHSATGTYLIDNLRLIDGPLGPCDEGNGTPKAAGTVCRVAAGDCDVPEACDGTSFACPEDSRKASGTTCREATGNCDPAETCDGTNVSCPADSKAADGTACSDGDACTQTDSCQAGACVGENPITCIATDACHEAGVCDPSTGVCSSPAKPDGTGCDDGDACTQVDICQSGLCVGDSPKTCTASDQCHDAGACDPATGECSNPAKADGTFCSDGDFCTQADLCESGTCTGQAPVLCLSSDQCHDAGVCDPATGMCSNPAKPDGAACSDGTACTQTDSCQSGVCVGANPVTCVASDQCHTTGTCDPATGVCSNPALPNGVACDDGDACTRTDTCQSGACTGTNPVTCVAQDQCHAAGTCDPATGVCSNPNKPDGDDCDDGNGCTRMDTCQAGACTGASPVECTAADECHEAGTCDPQTGICSQPVRADGTLCNDRDACTRTDTCLAGACVGSDSVVCTASDQCHLDGECNPATGLCSNPAKPDGATCDDGDACTRTDTCGTGICVGGNPVVCVPADSCHHAGTCDSETGTCSNPAKADGTACTDGSACTRTDVCEGGTCVGGNPVTCAPADQCHEAGTCSAATGQCLQLTKPDNTECDDGNASTQNDVCVAGTCAGGPSGCNLIGTLEAGGSSTCATWSDGSLFCWGSNSLGQLGDGSTVSRAAPTRVQGTVWSAVAVSSGHSCALSTEGGLWCWGRNDYGQVGDTSTTQRLSPTPVSGTDWARVSVPSSDSYHTCGIKTDGSLYCWGGNSFGQLGDDTTVGKTTPNPVATAEWASVSVGSFHTCAIKSDGRLFCWGDNYYGQLGIGYTYPSSKLVPTEVGGTDWGSVASGYAHTCAIKTSGVLYCWGSNSSGQLGVGGSAQSYLPVQVSGTGWAAVAAGGLHSCALKSDNTLRCWGYNYNGQLGDGTWGSRTSPWPVSGSDWKSISAGAAHTCAFKQDDSAWCWGSNSSGQLGDGGSASLSVPTKIGASSCKGICGDARRDWGEQCDDGNRSNDDGCSASCQIELCGNGTTDPGEQCDDGNHVAGDGCSPDCRRESCGDGTLEAGEECDDGNLVDGDGCSAQCLGEICGNMRVDPGEECDDGNLVDDDACSNACKLDRCYGVVCGNPASVCETTACNPANGFCESTPVPDGSPCDDRNACTETDVCETGQCVGTNPLDCSASNGCQLDGTCDTAKGCVIPSKADGTLCDDGSSCTASDFCEAGQCIGVVTTSCFQAQVTPIDPTVPTTVGSSTAFLYTGPDAVQTGMAAGTIEPVRAAVVRGHVKSRDGTPIGGVKITVAGHPEFGQTRTREDGWFDMAVNGGGQLHLVYERAGFLRSDRDVATPWQEYGVAPEVVMIPLDPAVTTVDLPAGGFQIAKGTVVTDEDGTRQAAIFFPPGVTATMVGPQFSLPLNRLSVRATEYTVGADGPAAMPAPLPANSGYTYAVELSADEAIAAGALTVQFSQSIYLYVNNFLDLPVGASAPVGTYDRLANWSSSLFAWHAGPSGRVIQVLEVVGGKATLAVDGSGQPASAQALAALGITDQELVAVAGSYSAGQSLWRVPLSHFSPEDVNLPFGYPMHDVDPYPRVDSPEREECTECPNTSAGSIIECESQALGQEIPIAGTPFALEYRSRATEGDNRGSGVVLPMQPLTGSLLWGLKEVVVKATIAGQEIEQHFDRTTFPSSKPSVELFWNGMDAYGRHNEGAQPARLTVGFVFPITYRSEADLDEIFGEWSEIPDTVRSRSAATITFLADVTNTAGARRAPSAVLGSQRNPVGELGGWRLNVHHAYDPQARVLFLGNGSIQSADNMKQVVTAIAGNGESVTAGTFDSGTALSVPVEFPWSDRPALVVAPTGDVLFSDVNQMGRIDKAGNLTRYEYDSRYVDYLTAGYDGAIYFLARNSRDKGSVMRMFPPYDRAALRTAQSFTMSGTEQIWAVAPAPDGSVYAVPGGAVSLEVDPGFKILKRTPGGDVRQVAGTSARGSSPDGTPAIQASLTIYDIAAGPDGSLYVCEGARVRRIGPDGVLTTVAGTGVSGYTGDGGSALEAKIWVTSLRVGSDGVMYLGNATTIRRVGADGIITTLVGAYQVGSIVNGSSARSALTVSAFSLAPDGSVLFVEKPTLIYAKHIWRVSAPLPGYEAGEAILASKDGRERYFFSATGRHLRTEDALTGVVLHQFEYNGNGHLTAVTDRAGLRTAIERDASGQPVAIVAPNGQRTTLTLDSNNYLSSITDPGGNSHVFTYSAGGLMESLRDPRGNLHVFEYDAAGRLTKDTDPAGGFTTLARSGYPSDYAVTKRTAEGRETLYTGKISTDGSSVRKLSHLVGDESTISHDPAGKTTWTSDDGTTGSVTLGPDPVVGMQAPIVASSTVRLPSGNQMTVEKTRAVSVGQDGKVLSQVDTTTFDGKAFTTTYSAAARTLTTVSPLGRRTVTTLDEKGRVVQTQLGNLAPTVYAYDARGRLSTVTVAPAGNARVTTFGYDELDRLKTLTDPLSREQGYSYDNANRVTVQKFSDGNAVNLAYDANGNVTTVLPPSHPAHTFGFTSVDLMASYTPPPVAGTGATTYEHNLDRQLTAIHRPDGSTISFSYDSAGRLSTVTYPKGPNGSGGPVVVTRIHNATTGRLETVRTSELETVSYGYDGNLLTSTTWAGTVNGTVSRTYDSAFRLASESVNGANSVAFGYDSDGLLIRAGGLTITRDSTNGLITDSTLGGVTDHRTYDSFGQVATYEAKFGSTSLYSVVYVRDSLGRIETKTETIQGTTVAWGYSYDSAGRLWQVVKDGAPSATYLYDSNGNRLSKTTPAGTETATYDDQDRLLTYGKWAYAYTANGELLTKTDTTSGAVTRFSYDGAGNLRKVELLDGRVIEYVIDPRGRRIAKKLNGHIVRRWLYHGKLAPVAELDGSGAVVSRFAAGGVIKGSTSYRVLADHLGSPRLVVDTSTGAIAQRMEHDEWGQVTAGTASRLTPFGFAAGVFDEDTGLVRFGARDYDAETGRWTTREPRPFAGRGNNYEYAVGEPVNVVDVTGLAPGDSYLTMNDAAMAALGDVFLQSYTADAEAAGWVYQKPDGSFTYTEPRWGAPGSDESGVSFDDLPDSPYTVCGMLPNPGLADYHTHGAPKRRMTNNFFSDTDMAGNDLVNGPGYLGSTEGRVGSYTPGTAQNMSSQQQIQRLGPLMSGGPEYPPLMSVAR